MGCDIHAVFQARVDGVWVDIPTEYDERRDYDLFAHLADVRNAIGATPIAYPRGLPEDFEVNGEDHPVPREMAYPWEVRASEKYGGHITRWMGEHSHSWLMAEEILDHDFSGGIDRRVITLDQYVTWDGVSPMYPNCRWTAGPGIKVSPAGNLAPDTTHVEVEWVVPTDEFDYFTNEVCRLRIIYDEVRFVFGFDN